ncbi:MAG TPA: SIS domain-containing protein [Pyrodictium sp.]|nr:SIS domain-containing protein [Pyrodictium sp.]
MSEGFDIMWNAYSSWKDYAVKSFEEASNTPFPMGYSKAKRVVVCGMGGSGCIGDYLASLVAVYGGVPVFTVKSYKLPAWVGENDLVVAVSFSGETLETLHCFREALARRALVYVVAGGGKLLREARGANVPATQIVKGPAARASFVQLFYATLEPLVRFGLVKVPKEHIFESIDVLGQVDDVARFARDALNATGNAKLYAFVSCSPFESLAIRAKNEVCENAKIGAIDWFLPESFHNDIEGSLEDVEASIVAFIHDDICSRMVKTLSEVVGAPIYSIELRGKTPLAKLMWGTLFAGLFSLLLASKHSVNPMETARIKAFRSRYTQLFS